MIALPRKAHVGRVLPKESFYKRLELNVQIKEAFVTDIKKITVEYKLTADTLNLDKGGDIDEVLVLSVELKKKKYDPRILENIARQNTHKLLFLLKYEGQIQLALYYSKLYLSEWMPVRDLNLEMKGFNLADIWTGFVRRIALKDLPDMELKVYQSLDDQLQRQEAIQRLQKDIDKLDKLVRSEKQPKKKFELYSQRMELSKILDQMQS